MNVRRSFLKGFGLLGVVAAGVSTPSATAHIVSESNSSVSSVDGGSIHGPDVEGREDITHLEPPDSATTIQICGSYGEKPTPPPPMTRETLYLNGLAPEVTHRVSMTVGKDNRLWIRVGDQWRRVALEG